MIAAGILVPTARRWLKPGVNAWVSLLEWIRWWYGPVLLCYAVALTAVYLSGTRTVWVYWAVAAPVVMVPISGLPALRARLIRKRLWSGKLKPEQGYAVVAKGWVRVRLDGTPLQHEHAIMGDSRGPELLTFNQGEQYPIESPPGIVWKDWTLHENRQRSPRFAARHGVELVCRRWQVQNRGGRARIIEVIEFADEPAGRV